jgi:hypothetical protein
MTCLTAKCKCQIGVYEGSLDRAESVPTEGARNAAQQQHKQAVQQVDAAGCGEVQGPSQDRQRENVVLRIPTTCLVGYEKSVTPTGFEPVLRP